MTDTERIRTWLDHHTLDPDLRTAVRRVLAVAAERDHWQALWADVSATVGAAENLVAATLADSDRVSGEAKRDADRLRTLLSQAAGWLTPTTRCRCSEHERCLAHARVEELRAALAPASGAGG